jgi:cytochrome b6-f complex iron-sulfur subunit
MTPIVADLGVSPFVLVVAGVVAVLLVLVAFVGAAKRRDTQDATGVLSRETVKRDHSSPADQTVLDRPVTGKEIERIAEAERKGVALEPKGAAVATATKPDVVPYVPPDPDTIGVTRRQFLNRSIIAFFIFGLSMFGVQVIAFLWPQPKGGFGSKIQVGKLEDILQKITAGKGYYYVAEGRMWMTAYPAADLEKARAVYQAPVFAGMKAGVNALYQKCPHLGCRVPSCVSSQWFECPCHGSQYNQVGEKKGGPAPRGMDRFGVDAAGGSVTVDTGTVFQGPPIGTNTTGQEAEGPHCVGGGGH